LPLRPERLRKLATHGLIHLNLLHIFPAMPIIVALICAVLFQFAAAFISISLIRRTKYNISWVLISLAFLLMALRRLLKLIEVAGSGTRVLENPLDSWLAVGISILILVGLIFIKRIFNLQKRIDDLKKENEARVLSAIIRTEENERQKFAKELHDGLGPLLSSIKMSVSALFPGRAGKENQKILDNTNRLIDESVSAIKEISNKLSPHVLNNFGLHRAIVSFVEKIKLSNALSIRVSSNIENTRFDYNIEVVLYRVVCELINNTIHHADATQVTIELHADGGRLTLDYYDNGKGFDAETVLNLTSGMGYSNIQSRIRSINGTLDIKSRPEEGIRINVTIDAGRDG
jgi:signal transduction histidine kinase